MVSEEWEMGRTTWDTDRLSLRPMRLADAEAIYSTYASDREVTRYLRWLPHRDVEETKALLRAWIAEDQSKEEIERFAICLRDEGRLIGAIDIVGKTESGAWEVGYVLGRAFAGKGYMSEALASFVAECFSRGCPALYACADERNLPSLRVLEKNGFRRTGKKLLSPISPWKEGECVVVEFLLPAPNAGKRGAFAEDSPRETPLP